jgi:hypothetical protein
MTDHDLEQHLRGLRLAPLPAALKNDMAEPPIGAPARLVTPQRRRSILPWIAGPLAAAAASVGVALLIRPAAPHADPGEAREFRPVSFSQRQSTLLDSRPLAVIQDGGRMWEVAEQQWRDEEFAFCSAAPVRLRSEDIRREIVFQPIKFQ